MKEYSEVEKQIARNEALKFAITTLTKNRHKSTVARKSYVMDIKDYFQTNGDQYYKEISSLLSESEIIHWESFYESIIRYKKAKEFFSGTAVVDQGAKSFEAKELKKRKLIKRCDGTPNRSRAAGHDCAVAL